MSDNINLLEKSGYSYSGISDIISEGEEKAFLQELEKAYQDIKIKQASLEAELERIKSERSHLVSCYIHAKKILIKDSSPLSFIYEGNLIVVKTKDENTIDHEIIPITIK